MLHIYKKKINLYYKFLDFIFTSNEFLTPLKIGYSIYFNLIIIQFYYRE